MTESNLYISAVLAHSMVYETKQDYSPNGIVDDARNDDPQAEGATEGAGHATQAFQNTLPQFMRTMLPYIQELEKARLAASQATSPAYSTLQTGLYQENAPKLAATDREIDAANRLAGARSDLAVLQGPGAESVRQVSGLMRELDPEFYKVREAGANSVMDLLGTGLTPGEEEAISRRLAQENASRGVLATPTATSTVANAMQFGDAARKRQLEGVGAATSFLPVSRTNFDPTQIALGRPSITTTGTSKFEGVEKPGTEMSGIATDLYNAMSGFQNARTQANANRSDWFTKVSGALAESAPDSVSI